MPPTWAGFVYVAFITDVFSRKITLLQRGGSPSHPNPGNVTLLQNLK